MVKIRVLGATEISIGTRRIGLNTELLFAIALYLTTRAGERFAREDLLEVFWSSGGGEDRRHALRQMLYRLRQKGLRLEEEGDWIGLHISEVDSDLRDALADGWPEKAEAAAVDAAATFTPSFSKRLSSEFHEWLDGVRDRLAAQHRRAALKQIYQARREARWADLERWAVPVLRTDPLNEEATLARAESAAMAGSKTIALEILDNYLTEVGEISEELGRPAALLRKRLAERRPDWATRGPKEVPLVGRAELMNRLTGLVEAAWRGEGSAVVLVGAPGIGKTRLAMEARAYAELKGMRTVVVRAEVGEVDRPLSSMLRILPELLRLPGTAGTDPAAMETLRQVSSPSQSSSARRLLSEQPRLRDDLVAAIVELARAISHESRVLCVVEDGHHVDSVSAVVLSELALQTRSTRLSWLGTARSSSQLRADTSTFFDAAPRLLVGTLDPSESNQLARSVASAHRLSLADADVAAISRAGGGNPLFVRELGIHRAIVGGRDSGLPQSLRDLMRDRLSEMRAASLRLLRVVTLLRSRASVERVGRLAGITPSDLTRLVESLENDGLLTLGESRHLELHEAWQQTIEEGLRGAARAALASECAEALLATGDVLTQLRL